MNEQQYIQTFETNAWAVALGNCYYHSHQAGDKTMLAAIIEELEMAKEEICHLEACFALEVN